MRIFNGFIYNGEKQIPQDLIFRRGMTYLIYSLKNRKDIQITKKLLKTEINHDQIDEDN